MCPEMQHSADTVSRMVCVVWIQVGVLKSIAPVRAEDVVLGQYVGSDDGSQPGYKDGKVSQYSRQ